MPAVAPGFQKPPALATQEPFSTMIGWVYRTRIALLPYYRGLTQWLIPGTKNHPQWTIKKCVSMTELQVLYAWVSWTRYSPPATLDAQKTFSTSNQGVWYPSAYKPLTDATKRIVLEFHVGGYSTGPSDEKSYEAGAKTVADATNSKVLVVFYRRCCVPGQHFPAQLQDVLSAYHYATHTLEIEPSRIVLSGDSAGGHLVLTFLRYLSEHGTSTGIPRPGAALVISCMLDLHEPTQKTLYENKNYNTDSVRKEHIDWSIETFVPGDMSTDDKWISPGRHPYAMPVPMYFEAGMMECLGPGIVVFAEQCRELTEDGIEVEINAIETGTHDSLWLGGKYGFDEEQQQAVQAVSKFLDRVGM